MLDLKFIISNLDEVKRKTQARNYSFDFESLIEKDGLRKNIITEVEKLKALGIKRRKITRLYNI